MGLSPRLPSFMHEIQFIKFYLNNPCDVPWTVYFETARPITGEIALTLLQFDFVQFVKTIFKPKWGRSGRHTRKGARGKRKGGGIPEIADTVANLMDPDGTLRPTRYPLAGVVMLEIWETIDRAFWTVFVVEMFEGLIINSVIGVIESDKSRCPLIGRGLRNGYNVTIGGAGEPERVISLITKRYSHKVDMDSRFGASSHEGTYAVVFSGTVEGELGSPTFQPVLFIEDIDGTRREMGGVYQLEEGSSVGFSVSATVRGPWGAQWRAIVPNGFAEIKEASAFVMQIGD